METIIENLKRRFTLPSKEAYDLSLFIQKFFYIKIYIVPLDYKNRVSNVSKRFSSVDSNKLQDELIFDRYQFYFIFIA